MQLIAHEHDTDRLRASHRDEQPARTTATRQGGPGAGAAPRPDSAAAVGSTG